MEPGIGRRSAATTDPVTRSKQSPPQGPESVAAQRILVDPTTTKTSTMKAGQPQLQSW